MIYLRRIIITVVFLFSSQLWGENAYLVGKIGTWSFSTTGVGNRSESASGFGAYNMELGYNLRPNWTVSLGLNALFSDGITGQAGFGFDLGGHYYFLSDPVAQLTENEEAQIKIRETWRPYFGLFLRQRTFNFVLSTTYVGPGVAAGLDYAWSTSSFLNLELRYDQLYGADEGEASQMNILIGVGIEL